MIIWQVFYFCYFVDTCGMYCLVAYVVYCDWLDWCYLFLVSLFRVKHSWSFGVKLLTQLFKDRIVKIEIIFCSPILIQAMRQPLIWWLKNNVNYLLYKNNGSWQNFCTFLIIWIGKITHVSIRLLIIRFGREKKLHIRSSFFFKFDICRVFEIELAIYKS